MQNHLSHKFLHLLYYLREFSSSKRFNLCIITESDQKRRIKGGSSEEEVITFLHRVKKLGREEQSLDEYLSDDVSFY